MALKFLKWIQWSKERTVIIENKMSDLEEQWKEISYNLQEIHTEIKIMKGR